MVLNNRNPETLVLHAGPRSDASTGAVAVPIYQTTSYQFRDTGHAANLFALEDFGNIYSRIMNPTGDVLEEKIAALDFPALPCSPSSSGQAASALAVQNICRAGDNIVSSTDLYGGTWNLFANTLHGHGHRGALRRPGGSGKRSARRPMTRTRAYYAETLPNPKLNVFPIGEVAAIGRELGVPLIMDNTAAPVICAGRSSMARPSSSIRRRNISAAMALRSAASSSMAATSTGPPTRRALSHAQRARSELSRRGMDRGGQAAAARSPTSSSARVVLLRDLGMPA